MAKKEGVTKIGNNTFFYTGPKGKAGASADTDEDMETGGSADDNDEDLEEDSAVLISNVGASNDDPDDDFEDEYAEDTKRSAKKEKSGLTYSTGRKKHRTNYVYGAKSTAQKARR